MNSCPASVPGGLVVSLKPLSDLNFFLSAPATPMLETLEGVMRVLERLYNDQQFLENVYTLKLSVVWVTCLRMVRTELGL